MRLLPLVFFSASFFASSLAFSAAPPPMNSLVQILDKACSDGACAEGYRIRFKQLSFEASKQQATAAVTLLPNQGIDYPILNEHFEAQIVQSSFAGICKIRHVPSLEMIREGDADAVQPDFLESLKTCLNALAERTERALGRSN